MKKNDEVAGSHGARLLGPLGLCAWLVAGCSTLQAEEPDAAVTQTADDVLVKVYFKGKCPVSVGDALVSAEKNSGKRLMWQAYNIDDPNGDPLESAEYSVYFDPFKGKTDDSNKRGVVRSQKLQDDLPANLLFKYTIVATDDDGKPDEDCLPLDPFFRIR